MNSSTVFVTVGSTSFDSLIDTILQPDTLDLIKSRGYSKVVLQTGRGKDFQDRAEGNSLEVEIYRFKDSIQPDMANASLIISHAGAGSILESLRLRKPVIVVVNEDLMDNHQIEVARKLHAEGYLAYATCRTLRDVLRDASFDFKPFPKPNPAVFQKVLDSEMGIHS